MEFSNLFFLYLFLPFAVGVYFIAPGMKLKNGILILFSLLFYCFGRPIYVPLMVALTALNYYIPKLRLADKATYSIVLILDVGSLLVFKVFTDLPYPMGLSFYLFSLIAYQVDRHRDPEGEADSFWQFLLFVSFFPKVVMGPIVRFKQLAPQLRQRTAEPEKIFRGAFRFAVGLGKKILIADPLFRLYEQLGSHASWVAPWVGGLAFMLYIFFEFSGYGDMAIGMGGIFGFSLPENFRRPYTAVSVGEFWRRWHMTLGLFFRDYVYIPLGGNRRGILRQMWNLLVVWVLTGLWHGISVTYVLWGLYFFLLLLGEKAFPVKGKRGILHLRRLVTFFLVYFGWIIFAAKDAVALYQTVIRMLSFDLGGLGPTLLVIRNNLPLLLVGILLAVPGPIWAERFRNWNRTLSLPGRKTVTVAQTFFLILIFALCTVVLLGTAAKPSMYAGF